jgi:hypothetical protein
MKQIRILKILIIMFVMMSGTLGPLVSLSGVAKADIDPNKCLFTPETVLFSAECADLYKKDCKSKNLGAQFCENLTYQEIARCADSEKRGHGCEIVPRVVKRL